MWPLWHSSYFHLTGYSADDSRTAEWYVCSGSCEFAVGLQSNNIKCAWKIDGLCEPHCSAEVICRVEDLDPPRRAGFHMIYLRTNVEEFELWVLHVCICYLVFMWCSNCISWVLEAPWGRAPVWLGHQAVWWPGTCSPTVWDKNQVPQGQPCHSGAAYCIALFQTWLTGSIVVCIPCRYGVFWCAVLLSWLDE